MSYNQHTIPPTEDGRQGRAGPTGGEDDVYFYGAEGHGYSFLSDVETSPFVHDFQFSTSPIFFPTITTSDPAYFPGQNMMAWDNTGFSTTSHSERSPGPFSADGFGMMEDSSSELTLAVSATMSASSSSTGTITGATVPEIQPKLATTAAETLENHALTGQEGHKKWASERDWDKHRPTITRLYVSENRKLWQLVDYMSKEHGFYATPKMYKTRFKRWGLWKNTKAADVAEALRQTQAEASKTTKKTVTTTKTTTTTTTVTTTESTSSSRNAAVPQITGPSKQQEQQMSVSQQKVFLVNNKQIDAQRIERYIRNRSRQSRMRPGDVSASLLTRHHGLASSFPPSSSTSTPNSSNSSRPIQYTPFSFLRTHRPRTTATATATATTNPPLRSNPRSPLIIEESTYATISNYFSSSLTSGRWVFRSPADCDLATEQGQLTAKISCQFFERFKVLTPLLSRPGTPMAADALKMARICFAELARILSGELGPEDPVLLVIVLTVLQFIRKEGEGLRWLEVQLASFMAELSAISPQPQGGGNTSSATPSVAAPVWRALRECVRQGKMSDHLSMQCTRVAVDICTRYLGGSHAKTLELVTCGFVNFDDSEEKEKIPAQEKMFRSILAELDALGTFDERHAGVRMNMATFYNLNNMPGEAAKVCEEVVCNEWMLGECKRYRGLAYKFFHELGHARKVVGDLEGAETAFKDGLEVSKWEMETHKGNDNEANIMEALVNLEKLYRDWGGREEDAERVLKERELWIRRFLEGVGEREDGAI